MRMSQARTEAEGPQKSLMRLAFVKSKYAKYYLYIKKLSYLISIKNMGSIELKDVVEDKRKQAILFNENKNVNLGEGALFYLAWLSLANAVLTLKEKINFCDKTMLQIVNMIISNRQLIEDDIVNVLYLFRQRRNLLYYLLKFELEESSFPFDLDHVDYGYYSFDEQLKFNTVFSAFSEIFLWEKKSGKIHPAWKFLESVQNLTSE